MWELIRRNQQKSVVLIILMGLVLVGFGAALGSVIAPGDPVVTGLAILVSLGVWLVMLLVSMAGGEKILLASAHAREIEKKDAPQLYNIVEEMCIASGLNVMPKVYIIDTPEPNAFAVGLKPKRAAVAVTAGLLSKLNRDELQGVIAHEIAHIQNRDTLFMTLAGVTVGAIILLSELAWRSLRFGSLGRSRNSSSKNSGQLMIVVLVVAVIMAILAPILARLLYFACSRRREYLADACAVQYTRFPEGLASALDKISGQAAQRTSTATVSRTLAPMYIVNPLAARGKKAGLFSTHPASDERIKILRGMTSQASLVAYEEAYHALHPKDSALTPSLRAASVEQPVREASATAGSGDAKKNWRDVQNILHKVNQYAMLACTCGLNIKVPPNYDAQKITCPKCGQVHPVPTEMMQTMQSIAKGPA